MNLPAIDGDDSKWDKIEKMLDRKISATHFEQCCNYGNTRWMVFTSKMCGNTCGRVTFHVKMQVIDLHLYLKCHSSTGVFHTFC